jgi:hypothetical protein
MGKMPPPRRFIAKKREFGDRKMTVLPVRNGAQSSNMVVEGMVGQAQQGQMSCSKN